MNDTRKNNDLINIIQQKYDDFSKGQKLIANYIVNHYDKAAYVTAAKLGEIVGVSESTVVRFAIELGFDGYPKLQKVLQELIKSKLTAVQRIEVSSNRINEDNILKSVLQSDMDKIKITLEQIDNSDFNNIVETILGAKRIFILGVRSSAPLASFLGFYFNLIFDNVRLVHTTSVSEMFEQIIRAQEGDVVIGVSFPRYSKRTIKAMQFAKKQGVKTIALTDSAESPVAKSADMSLLARSDMASFVDSLVAPLSLINALIVAIGMRRKKEVYNTFEKLEKIWDEYQVYEKDDGYGGEKL
ncbi:HTH-type transcriptional regulator MurR [Ruminiclostridium hungatei]|uniref:HTH-type transcriptional regulator MurR n=1 Tax=Ruminiclostridium hungatei TaxID=48256 RepID=A0A1V4SIG7_RUMHU|nr:MurR/RpiR family transcriptional regulator [Ruminiclostridium hungatei]OPX43660.1 HTH-type transcriptional regulator MurR [Ruminiclostridium hungatei]